MSTVFFPSLSPLRGLLRRLAFCAGMLSATSTWAAKGEELSQAGATLTHVEQVGRLHEVLLYPGAEEGFLDQQHRYITQQFLDLTRSLDHSLSGASLAEEAANDSYLILKGDSRFGEGGEHEYSLDAKGKADLRHTKRRLKLIFESQPDEDLSVEESERQGRLRGNDLASESAIAGIRYAKLRDRYAWKTAFDLGSRFRFPVDLFARVEIEKTTALDERWGSYLKLQHSQFAREGARPSVSHNLYYDIDDHWVFIAATRWKYARQESRHEVLQALQLNQWVSPAWAMEYSVGAFGDNSTRSQLQGYFAEMTGRWRIYDDWMYLTLTPEVTYPRERGWSAVFAFTLELQAIYAD